MNYEPNLAEENRNKNRLAIKAGSILAATAMFLTGCATSAESEPKTTPRPPEVSTLAPQDPTPIETPPQTKSPNGKPGGSLEDIKTTPPTPNETVKQTPTPEQTPEEAERHKPMEIITIEEIQQRHREMNLSALQSSLRKGNLEDYAYELYLLAVDSTETKYDILNYEVVMSDEHVGTYFVVNDAREMDADQLWASVQLPFGAALAQTADGTADLDDLNEAIDPTQAGKIRHLGDISGITLTQYSDDGGEYARERHLYHDQRLQEVVGRGNIDHVKDFDASPKIMGHTIETIGTNEFEAVHLAHNTPDGRRVVSKYILVPLISSRPFPFVEKSNSNLDYMNDPVEYNTPRFDAEGNPVTLDGEPVLVPVFIGLSNAF